MYMYQIKEHIWRDGGHTIRREKYPIPLFKASGWSIDDSGDGITISLNKAF